MPLGPFSSAVLGQGGGSPFGEDPGQPDQAPQFDFDNANSAADEAVSLGNERGEQFRLQNGAPPISKIEMNVNDDGTKDYKIHANEHAINWIQQMIGIGQQTIQAREEQIRMLKERQDMLAAHPVLSQLGRIASEAGAQYFAPGSRGAALVRGAGYAGGEFFSRTPEQLQGDIADLKGRNLAASIGVNRELDTERRLDEQQKRDEARQDRLEARDLDRQIDTRMQGFISAAGRGVAVAPGVARSAAIQAGAKPDQAQTYEDQVQTEVQGYRKRQQDNLDGKQKEQEFLETQRKNDRLFIQRQTQDARTAAQEDSRATAQIGLYERLGQQRAELQRGSEKAVETLNNAAVELRRAGVPGFDAGKPMNPEQAANALGAIYSSGAYRDANGKLQPVLTALGANQDPNGPQLSPKYLDERRKEVESAIADYRRFKQQAPQLEAAASTVKAAVGKKYRDLLPDLAPPKAPPPAAPTDSAFTKDLGAAPKNVQNGRTTYYGRDVIVKNGRVYGRP